VRLVRGKADVAVFLAIAFGFSWLVALVIWQAGWRVAQPADPRATIALVVYVAGPAVAAIACALLFDKGRRAEALGLRNPFNAWLVWAWLIPMLLVAGTLAITLAFSGRGYQSADGASIALALIVIPLINTPILLGEELGWRGWLWDRWRGLGFWRNVLATGVVWGLWHAPIVALGHNYPGQPISGPALMVLVTLLLAPTFHLVRERGGSVWHASFLHGTYNAVSTLAIALVSDISMPWTGVVGIGGLAASAVAVAVVWAVLRR
jgi:membrane protease YdiL (CAAX protease family)